MKEVRRMHLHFNGIELYSNHYTTGGGWGIFKRESWQLFIDHSVNYQQMFLIRPRRSQVRYLVNLIYSSSSEGTDSLTDEFNSLSASAHKWYDGLHLADAGESLWVKVVELGQSLDADVLLPHAMELHPPEKVHEFKQSVDIVISTATELHQMVLATAEQQGVPPDSVKEEFGAIFNAILEKLQELFPPPAEAPGHENRTAMVGAVLDFIDESFSQFAIKLGASEESIKVYSDLLKSHVQIIVVTIGTSNYFTVQFNSLT